MKPKCLILDILEFKKNYIHTQKILTNIEDKIVANL